MDENKNFRNMCIVVGIGILTAICVAIFVS